MTRLGKLAAAFAAALLIPGMAGSAAPVAAPQSDDTISVYFNRDSSELIPSGEPLADMILEQARARPYRMILLEAHTDAFTSEAYAVGLTRRMAESVRDYLAAHGADPSRIEIRAYGSSRPVTPAAPGVQELDNRRVDMRVIRGDAPPKGGNRH